YRHQRGQRAFLVQVENLDAPIGSRSRLIENEAEVMFDQPLQRGAPVTAAHVGKQLLDLARAQRRERPRLRRQVLDVGGVDVTHAGRSWRALRRSFAASCSQARAVSRRAA